MVDDDYIKFLKCMGIMQADNLRHPYILSTTVLSDNYVLHT